MVPVCDMRGQLSTSAQGTEPAQPRPSLRPCPSFTPCFLFHPKSSSSYTEYEVKSGCPQATAVPGLGLALGSSSHSTHWDLHPFPSIAPKINGKMMTPPQRSIRRRDSTPPSNQDLPKSHFSFYISSPPPPPLFFSLSWEVAVSHKTLPQKDLSSPLRAAERLQPPSSSLPMGTAPCLPGWRQQAPSCPSMGYFQQQER